MEHVFRYKYTVGHFAKAEGSFSVTNAISRTAIAFIQKIHLSFYLHLNLLYTKKLKKATFFCLIVFTLIFICDIIGVYCDFKILRREKNGNQLAVRLGFRSPYLC